MSSKITYLSNEDFMKGITGQEIDWEVPGLGWVRIRGLEVLENAQLYEGIFDGDGDPPPAERVESVVRVIGAGLVQPKLTKAEIAKLHRGIPGPITALYNKIQAISGIGDEEDVKNSLGAGSSPPPKNPQD